MFFWKKKVPVQKREERRILLSPKGIHYDLQSILDEINRDYFGHRLNLPITWHGNPNREAKWRRTLGSYHFKTGVIRIHRLLDHPHFPPYFLSYIVYHEMLHSLVPPQRKRGERNRIHHLEFKAKEKEFRQYALAKAWEKQHRKHGLNYGRP